MQTQDSATRSLIFTLVQNLQNASWKNWLKKVGQMDRAAIDKAIVRFIKHTALMKNMKNLSDCSIKYVVGQYDITLLWMNGSNMQSQQSICAFQSWNFLTLNSAEDAAVSNPVT